MNNNRKAFALSIVLWIVAALMLGISVLLSFAKDNNNQIKEIQNKLHVEILAEEVLEILKYYIMTSDSSSITLRNSVFKNTKYKIPNKIILDDRIYDIDNNCSFQIMDTSGLLNVMSSSVYQFIASAALTNRDRQLKLEMQDSFLDWTDIDQLVRLNGAESVFYKMKKRALYKPRNKKTIQDIEEIRLINGFDKLPIEQWNKIKDISYLGMAQLPNILLMDSGQLEKYLDVSSIRSKGLVKIRKKNINSYMKIISKLRTYDEDMFFSAYSQQLRIKIVVKKGKAVSKLEAIISFIPSDERAFETFRLRLI